MNDSDVMLHGHFDISQVSPLTACNKQCRWGTLTRAFFSHSEYTDSRLGSLCSGWEYMRCSKASTLWMTFFSAGSLMPMSSMGSSRGTPSGKRFCTSCGRFVWKGGENRGGAVRGLAEPHQASSSSTVSYQDGLEHELPVVVGPQVFGDVKAD